MRPLQQLRQLSNAGRDLPRLILRHEIRCGTRLPGSDTNRHTPPQNDCVADGTGDPAIFLDGPRRWEVALGHGSDCTHRRAQNDPQARLTSGS